VDNAVFPASGAKNTLLPAATSQEGKRNERAHSTARQAIRGLKFDTGADPVTGKHYKYAFKGTKKRAG
jgi:hypothetical protein